ncbi:MAG: serine/threonine-protein kinase [Sandaracinus sp.]
MAEGPTTPAVPGDGKPAGTAAARPVVPKPAAVGLAEPAPAAAAAPASGETEPDHEAEVEVAEPVSAASSKSGPSGASNGGLRTSNNGPDPLIGRVINDRFRIVALLARGGMGKVYRAEQAPLGREVALKVLNPNYNGDNDPEFHKRFFLEASTCSKLTHPNTVTIFDYGRTDDDVYYIAMELLEGRTLHRALREEGPFSTERALHIARQICRSLREAHGLGVIHRDLKPANVYLVRHGDENDFVKVLDFGLVKNVDDKGEDLTQTGLFMGSPKYMSPEQIRGERADARADVYSLGVMIYEMVTGKVPFDRPNSVNILMAHVHEAPPPFAQINPGVQVPEALEALVMRCLSKQADDRFGSMEELLGAMKGIVDLGTSGERGSLPTGRHAALRQSGDGQPSLTPSGVVVAPPSGGVPVPATTTSGVPSAPPPSAASRMPMFAALGLGAALLVGLVWYATNGAPTATTPITPSTDVPVTTATGPGATTTTGTAPPPTSAAPEIARTHVSLSSTPAGATVAVGDDTYGPTPTSVDWTGDDARPGREVTFVFHLDGHQDYSVVRTVTGETLDVSATLAALPTGRPFRPRPPRRPEGDDGSGSVGPVKGYKLDPY